MDENYMLMTLFKEHISDLVKLVGDVVHTLLQLENDRIHSILYSNDRTGIIL